MLKKQSIFYSILLLFSIVIGVVIFYKYEVFFPTDKITIFVNKKTSNKLLQLKVFLIIMNI